MYIFKFVGICCSQIILYLNFDLIKATYKTLTISKEGKLVVMQLIVEPLVPEKRDNNMLMKTVSM